MSYGEEHNVLISTLVSGVPRSLMMLLPSFILSSKDVICRWTYPFVPDVYSSGGVEDRVRYNRHNIYCSKGVTLARYRDCLCCVVRPLLDHGSKGETLPTWKDLLYFHLFFAYLYLYGG